MGLFSQVVEGTYGYDMSSSLSAEDQYEIESLITDDPMTVSEYTAYCFEGMMACELALAKMEGRCAVEYLTSASESTKYQLQNAMEVSLSGAWDAIKNFAEKAWEAIKKFIKKIWGKVKGYASQVTNMFSKYSEVLDKKKLTGLKVNIHNFKSDPSDVANTVQQIVHAYEEHLSGNNALPYDDTSGIGRAPFNDNQAFMRRINNAAFGNNDGPTAPESTTITPALLNKYVSIADQGQDKYFSMFLQLGEKALSEYKKQAKAAYDKGSDKYNKKTRDTGKTKESGLNRMKHAYQRICNVIKMGSNVYSTRIQLDYGDAVRVCRAAVRYQSGDATAGTSNESFTDFDSMLSEIL